MLHNNQLVCGNHTKLFVVVTRNPGIAIIYQVAIGDSDTNSLVLVKPYFGKKLLANEQDRRLKIMRVCMVFKARDGNIHLETCLNNSRSLCRTIRAQRDTKFIMNLMILVSLHLAFAHVRLTLTLIASSVHNSTKIF